MCLLRQSPPNVHWWACSTDLADGDQPLGQRMGLEPGRRQRNASLSPPSQATWVTAGIPRLKGWVGIPSWDKGNAPGMPTRILHHEDRNHTRRSFRADSRSGRTLDRIYPAIAVQELSREEIPSRETPCRQLPRICTSLQSPLWQIPFRYVEAGKMDENHLFWPTQMQDFTTTVKRIYIHDRQITYLVLMSS